MSEDSAAAAAPESVLQTVIAYDEKCAKSAFDVSDVPAPHVPNVEAIHRENYDRWKAYDPELDSPAGGRDQVDIKKTE